MNNQMETERQRGASSLRERTAIWIYLLRVDWRLSRRGIGWNHRMQISRELRANALAAVSHQGSMRKTLAGLGTPTELATAYADPTSQRGVLHHAAAGWAVAAMAALQAVGIGIALGFQRGAEAAGMEGAVSYTFEFAPGFGPFSGTFTANPMAAELALVTPAHLVIMLAAALVGGRTWRILTRRGKR